MEKTFKKLLKEYGSPLQLDDISEWCNMRRQFSSVEPTFSYPTEVGELHIWLFNKS